MPNWVRNNIIAREPETLKKLLLDENGNVDFNKVIPMPQDLQITSGSMSYKVQHKTWFSEFTAEEIKKQQPITDEFEKLYNDTMTQQEFASLVVTNKPLFEKIRKFLGLKLRGQYAQRKDCIKDYIETFAKGFFNLKRYGERDWYEWSINNWGCKWNASESRVDTKFDGTMVISFDTPWSPPQGVLEEIAKHTPIRVCWSDEGCSPAYIEDYYLDEDDNLTNSIVLDNTEYLGEYAWDYGQIHEWNSEKEEMEFNEEKTNELDKKRAEYDKLMSQDTFNKDFQEV